MSRSYESVRCSRSKNRENRYVEKFRRFQAVAKYRFVHPTTWAAVNVLSALDYIGHSF